ncbi:MAG: hypothetical protein B6244_11105 [Candidatus Cloacimonetes bacterium 4572_55]|nr:MAG: hypothetical protein B6244_11105 [Candidatus Cloacimonetes bacterium 4572_55]
MRFIFLCRRSPLNRIFFLLTFAILALFSWNCTSNSLTDDGGDISDKTQSLKGYISLNDHASPEGVYVWLETFGIGTYTDTIGYFQLPLPPPSQQSGGGLDGVFKLYYFFANYQYETSDVIIRSGTFNPATSDFDDNAELHYPKILNKLIDIDIRVWCVPPQPGHEEESMAAEMIVQSYGTPVSLRIPSMIQNWLSGFILKRTKNDDVTYQLITQTDTLTTQEVQGRHVFQIQMNLTPSTVEQDATYQIIPYLYIDRPGMPTEIYESIGIDLTDLSLDYLNYPIRYESPEFLPPFE